MNIIAIVNQKGGVGKTTTTINLSAALAKQGQRVLVVDLDPQRNATTSLNRNVEYEGPGINDLIYFTVSGLPIKMEDFIQKNETEAVDFIPSTPILAAAPNILAQDKDSYVVLRRLLRTPYLQEHYDYILIDCKPSLDLLVGNALVAADKVIVPVVPEEYAIDGMGDLWDTVLGIQERYNETLEISGILITLVNAKRKASKRIIEQLRESFGAMVYDTLLPNLADVGNATDEQLSVVNYNCRLGKLYEQLAQEVIQQNV